MKDAPKRAGEVVDLICQEAGISDRLVPHVTVLNKQEAVAVLELIRTLRELVRTEGKGGPP